MQTLKQEALYYLKNLKNRPVKERSMTVHVMKYGSNNNIYSKVLKTYIRFQGIKECLENKERIQVVSHDGRDITLELIAKINKRFNTEFTQKV